MLKEYRMRFSHVGDYYVLGIVSRFIGLRKEMENQLSIKGDKRRLFTMGLEEECATIEDVSFEIRTIHDSNPQVFRRAIHPSCDIREVYKVIFASEWIERGHTAAKNLIPFAAYEEYMEDSPLTEEEIADAFMIGAKRFLSEQRMEDCFAQVII